MDWLLVKYICENYEEAEKAVEEIFNGKFGETNQVLIESFWTGKK